MMNPVSILMLLLTILGAENIFAQTAPPPDLSQEQAMDTAPVIIDDNDERAAHVVHRDSRPNA
jgi:hypothetical protein